MTDRQKTIHAGSPDAPSLLLITDRRDVCIGSADASVLHDLHRRLLPRPTFAHTADARRALLSQHLTFPSGLVEHDWKCLDVAAESVHALEQRLAAAYLSPVDALIDPEQPSSATQFFQVAG